MEDFLDGLVPLIAIISAVALPIIVCGYVSLYFLKSRRQERLELVKQGIVPREQPKPSPNKYASLRNGFLCVGIAVGVILGFIVNQVYAFEDLNFFLILTSSVLLFLGLAYILFYVLTKDKDITQE